MMDAAQERRRAKKNQTPYPKSSRNKTHAPQDRPPATANGVRQIVTLAHLPPIAKQVVLDPQSGEVVLTMRLKAPSDLRALKMILLIYEANGWNVCQS